jgi:hypothetical protein
MRITGTRGNDYTPPLDREPSAPCQTWDSAIFTWLLGWFAGVAILALVLLTAFLL